MENKRKNTILSFFKKKKKVLMKNDHHLSKDTEYAIKKDQLNPT
jgi:hypothetical protein